MTKTCLHAKTTDSLASFPSVKTYQSYGLDSDIVCIKQHNTDYEGNRTPICGTATGKTANFRPIPNML